MSLSAGSLVDGRYTVESLLGKGGMATVYRVRHNQLHSAHALKILDLPAASIRERLLAEGRVQATLQHRNIVAVTDVVTVSGAPGLIMELIEGPSLDELLQEHRLTFDQADQLARGIIAGVGAAHRHGRVHRDLKPANVMLQVTREGLIPKVADFGLAKVLTADGDGAGRTRSGLAMGTPPYMAPEQIRDAKNVDHRADIFSLGAILYELVCRRRAFVGGDMLAIFNNVSNGVFVPAREIVPELPERMERAIDGALRTELEARIGSCDELLAIWKGEVWVPDEAEAPPAGPWTGTIIAHASSYGSGEQIAVTASEPAPVSSNFDETFHLPEHVDGARDREEPEARPTAVPVSFQIAPSVSSAAESMVQSAPIASKRPPSAASLPQDSRPKHPVDSPALGEAADGAAGSLAPQAVSAPGSGRSGLWLGVVLGIGGALGAVLIGLQVLKQPDSAPVEAVVETVQPANIAEPPAPPPLPDPVLKGEPIQVEQTLTPPTPTQKARAVETAPARPAAPQAAPSPKKVISPPKPVSAPPIEKEPSEPEPNPAAAPSAPIEAADPTTATLVVKGDAKSVWLVGAAGRFQSGAVPPGTYKVQAFFEEGKPVNTGSINLTAGQTKVLKCSSALMVCR